MNALDIDHSSIESGDVSDKTFRGPRFSFVVLSRSRIRYAAIAEPYIVVSISDSGDGDAEIAVSPLCRAILRLQFDDIDPQRKSLRGGTAMTSNDARSLLDFVRSHIEKTDVGTIVCQCGLGISRSAAVAAALSKYLQGDDTFFFARFFPNLHVYKTLLAALEEESGAIRDEDPLA